MTLHVFCQCFILPKLVYSNSKANTVQPWVYMSQHALVEAVYYDTH